MPIAIDESWEYWTPDPEVAELLADTNERVVMARKHTLKNEFAFCFAGSRDMASGRFFDGIRFGRGLLNRLWFAWDVNRKAREAPSSVVQIYESWLREVAPGEREVVLARAFVSAWEKLPSSSRVLLEGLLAWSPGPKLNPSQPGRRRGAFTDVGERMGRSKLVAYRWYLKTQHCFLLEVIPEERRPKCACGCGLPAPIAYVNNRVYGHVAGMPVRFITGHNSKRGGAEVLAEKLSKEIANHPNPEAVWAHLGLLVKVSPSTE